MTPSSEEIQIRKEHLEGQIRATSVRAAEAANSTHVFESMLAQIEAVKPTVNPQEKASLMADPDEAELTARSQAFKAKKRTQANAKLLTKAEQAIPQSLDSQQIVNYITNTLSEANS